MASSPLPDSTALEAGILEDPRPSRLSRVQDNVRNLLRSSVFGSVASSPTSPTHPGAPQQQAYSIPRPPTPDDNLRTHPTQNPLRSHPPTPVLNQQPSHARPEALPSPTDSTTSTHYSERSGDAIRCPPGSYYHNIQRMAHQSALFNTRAVAALNHPDLSDPSLDDLSQQKSNRRHQPRGWTRSRNGSASQVGSGTRRKRSRVVKKAAGSHGLLLTLAAFLLAALVATYVALATTVQGVTTTFHILFILGILLATVVFSHALIRFFLATKRRSKNLPTFVRVTRHGQQRHHRHHHGPRHQHSRQMPTLAGETREGFVPPTPIQVEVPGEEVRPDATSVQPTATVERAQEWDKTVLGVPNPPPAYGRWRDSVRADPNLLHWQAIPSPATPDTPAMPSPTYEEAMAAARHGETSEGSHPPSYMTRDSPARQRDMQEARAGLAQSQVVEPEMVEVRPVNASAPAVNGSSGPNVGLAM